MIWETKIINVEALTGEILTDVTNYIMTKKDQTVTFKDFNHAVKTITKQYKQNPQREIDFGFKTELEQWQDEQP